MQRVGNPIPIWLDQRGALVDAGRIYFGVAGQDPEVSPIDVFWDIEGTIPALQPLRTRGGVIVNNGAPAIAYVAEADYSTRVRDADNNQISYVRTASDAGTAAYQPLADALTALATTVPSLLGLDLIEAADPAAARALLGITAAYLALTGGTVSGNIIRQGAGGHLYFNDAAMTSPRVFVTAVGASDPTANPGDLWLKY